MVSSTITELAELRDAVAAGVNQAGVAEAWLFEHHATASGNPPEEQYLRLAATCDLYILVVAAQGSAATTDEYLAAYDDNPEKVLPFFLGDTTDETAHLRRLVSGRHTFVKRAVVGDLGPLIIDAVIDAVLNGVILRRMVAIELDRRIERSRTAIADIPVLVRPHVDLDQERRPVNEVVRPGARIALRGIGGAGKSTAAAVAARHAVRDGRTLPVVVTAGEERPDVETLIRHRLGGLKFVASDDLLTRWSHEGRVLLVVDGVEALTPTSRRRLFVDVARWADRFPRSGVAVCARRFDPLELDGFDRVDVAPLGTRELDDLLAAAGLGGHRPRLSPQIADIARWPMWATALIAYGFDAETGLELLRQLVTARMRRAGMSSTLERSELRSAAGALALKAWPATSVPSDTALDHVRRWASQPGAASTFVLQPASDVLHRLAEAGLVEVGEDVAFPHRLLATALAAEAAVDSDEPPDVELAPFVAAVADDDRHVDQVRDVLAAHDVFTVARYLRLSPPRTRTGVIADDVRRLVEAHLAWSPVGEALDVIYTERWIVWRPDKTGAVTACTDADEFPLWRRASDATIHSWSPLPFADRTPEFVAAAYTLDRFRSLVVALDPGGSRWSSTTRADLRVLARDRNELAARTLEALRSRRELRLEMTESLGLAHVPTMRPPPGEPRATVVLRRRDASLVFYSWGHAAPAVEVVDEHASDRTEQRSSMLLSSLLDGNDRAAAYDDLNKAVENALGCRLQAQTWTTPELVPAWVW
jgi:hypothetical protein